ncbi:class I SAM-dependent methyltransferase [Streptosporangiaceae bacterium NEAU-GS5]|nr:class I SAM-dependent methyltransferase [Streptosporangiaceae bacterium NEAU-GS5]
MCKLHLTCLPLVWRTVTEPGYLRATREFYDTIAVDYDKHFHDDLTGKPFDRAMLAAFAELVHGAAEPVADVGCGPGRIAAHLRSLGVPAFGVDLSPVMVDLARRAHPDLRFDVGTMTGLEAGDGTLAGVVAWYSIIHLPPDLVPDALAEFHRVLAPGGALLLAFQVGDVPLHLDRPFDHPVSLDFNRLQPERVADLLCKAGFAMTARFVREPGAAESVPQACLLARKP